MVFDENNNYRLSKDDINNRIIVPRNILTLMKTVPQMIIKLTALVIAIIIMATTVAAAITATGTAIVIEVAVVQIVMQKQFYNSLNARNTYANRSNNYQRPPVYYSESYSNKNKKRKDITVPIDLVDSLSSILRSSSFCSFSVPCACNTTGAYNAFSK